MKKARKAAGFYNAVILMADSYLLPLSQIIYFRYTILCYNYFKLLVKEVPKCHRKVAKNLRPGLSFGFL